MVGGHLGGPEEALTCADNRDRFVFLGATVHLSRRFRDSAEQHGYTIVAAPGLHRGQRLADELFGGSSLGRVSRIGAWYGAEAVQLRQRRGARR